MCQAEPTTTRSLPTRSCKTKISYEDKDSSDGEQEKEANLNESAKNSTQNEVNDTTEENDEKKEDTTNVWNEQINEKFSEFKTLRAKWTPIMKKSWAHKKYSVEFFEEEERQIQYFLTNWSTDKSEKLLNCVDQKIKGFERFLAANDYFQNLI